MRMLVLGLVFAVLGRGVLAASCQKCGVCARLCMPLAALIRGCVRGLCYADTRAAAPRGSTCSWSY